MGNGSVCIKIADNIPARDSKTPEGPALVFQLTSWASFVNTVKHDRI
ncbi:DUF397 domain-containing protein [Streptomyces luteireticuli]